MHEQHKKTRQEKQNEETLPSAERNELVTARMAHGKFPSIKRRQGKP